VIPTDIDEILICEPDPDYRARPALSWSRLKILDTSPLLYRWRLAHPRPDTPALAFGRAVHLAVLQPDLYGDEVVAYTGKTRRGKAWDAFSEEHAGRQIITQTEEATIAAIVAAVESHPDAGPMVAGLDYAERSIAWTEDGRDMRARCDLIRFADGRVLLVDLKTARDIDPRAFGRSAVQYGYHGQMAHYAAGLEALLGVPVDCAIIAVEKDAPHDVAVYHLDDLAMYAGQAMRRRLLDTLAACEAADKWPGKAPDPMPLQLPEWAIPDVYSTFTYTAEEG